jgi:two-component system copper resistance phosphate regulon response regulator CusR
MTVQAIMRLLLVEDEKKVSEFVARGLRGDLYAVDISHDGEKAWEMIQSSDYDLIILDLMLPGLSGTDLLRRLREAGHKMPILVLTARDSMADKVLNFETGADDYLTKPFAFAELAVRVKALLRRNTTERTNVLRMEDLEVDRLTRRVKRAGKRIDLTVKEYSLLEFLVAHPGRVLSRRVIIDHVWDSSFGGLAKIVDIHIGNLRAKMDTGYAKRLIHTVRGIGYAMEIKPPS